MSTTSVRALRGPRAFRLPASLRGRELVLPLAETALIVALWAFSLTRVDLGAMGDTGLMSVLPWTALGSLAYLVVTFSLTLVAPRVSPRLLGAHVTTFVVLLTGTPALLYGTLRYSWAWKHVGIIDYIDRLGSVDPHITTLGVYHNWPGFFAFGALITRTAGMDSALSYASWAPLFFSLVTMAAAAVLMRALTDDGRTVALAVWIFVLGNWVGQAYFSPQALNYAWYLIVLVILVRWFPGPAGGTSDFSPPLQRVGLMSIALLLLVSIVSTHQLTPIVMILVLAALVLFRRTSARTLPLFVGILTGSWLLFVAAPFTRTSLAEAIGTVGDLTGNVKGTLIDYDQVSSGAVLVSLMARSLTLLICVLAILGALRSIRRGRRNTTALLLAFAPFGIVALSPYGQEVLFRAYLFALPGLAFLAASLLLPPGSPSRPWTSLAVTLVGGLLLAGFLYAYYGNERQYHFTQAEAAAAQYLYEVAPPNSLLIEGSRNYPTQFRHYERFTYVPISREPWLTKLELVEDPTGVLSRWMSNRRYATAYLIITRSQKAESEALGEIPAGGLDAIEHALLASPKFDLLYRNEDASIFVLADTSDEASPSTTLPI